MKPSRGVIALACLTPVVGCILSWLIGGEPRFITTIPPLEEIAGVYGYSDEVRASLTHGGFYVHGSGEVVLNSDGSMIVRGGSLKVSDSPRSGSGIEFLEVIPEGTKGGEWDLGKSHDGLAVLYLEFKAESGRGLRAGCLMTRKGDRLGFWPLGDPDTFGALEPVMCLRKKP